MGRTHTRRRKRKTVMRCVRENGELVGKFYLNIRPRRLAKLLDPMRTPSAIPKETK